MPISSIDKTISQKDALIIQTNHNEFVRTAIASIAEIILVNIIVATIAGIIIASILFFVENHYYDYIQTKLIWLTVAVASVFSTVYLVVTIRGIIKLYKKTAEIEEQILEK